MTRTADILTTGDVARICKVAPRTVTKWFDTGQLLGYRIPGSKDRRIPLDGLVRFMRQNNVPLDGLSQHAQTRVLIMDPEHEIAETLRDLLCQQTSYVVQVARNGFEAGLLAQLNKPHVILLDVNLSGVVGRDLCSSVRLNPNLQMTKVIAMSIQAAEAGVPPWEGFDGFLRKPFNLREAIQAVEDAVAIGY